jgi:glycosyltransferase involved in cell wall biosynthesis
LTDKNRKEVERLYGMRNVQVLSPGGFTRVSLADASQSSLPPATAAVARPILLSVCRLIAKKRVDLLISAFRIFLDQNPQSTASLVIGGTGPEKDALCDLADGLGLNGRVRFVGFIPDSDLRGWYQLSDVFLSADNADYDLSVMMALPERKKIIVSTQYDIPGGLISLRRFFFVAEPSPRGFAEAIAHTLATTVPNANHGDECELQALTWESYFEMFLNLSAPHALQTA